MLVSAVDPGRGTGIAIYDTNKGYFTSWEWHDGYFDVEQLAGCDVIVVEKYEINEGTTRKSDQRDALNHIGVIKAHCARTGTKCVEQQRNVRKWGEPKLKFLGWQLKSKDGHADAAAGHLLRYLEKNKLLRAEDRQRLRDILR